MLAFDKSTKDLVATVQIVEKSGYFSNEQTKFLQITGLKTHSEYRNQGIASELINFIEQKAKSLGIFKIFVKLNCENYKAQKLFKGKFEYEQVSMISVVIIPDPIPSPSVQKLLLEQALKYTKNFYLDKDLALANFEEIFESPAYLGSFIIEKNNEFLGGSLWNLSYYSEVELCQVFVDIKYIKNNFWFRILCFAFVLSIFLYFFAWYLVYRLIEENQIKILVFSIASYITFQVFKVYMVAVKYLKQARKTFKPRTKVFGIFYSNTLETKKEWLFEFLSHMNAVFPCEYSSIEFNEDDVYRSAFKNEDFLKVYFQKNLDGSQVFKWNKRHFIDPRD